MEVSIDDVQAQLAELIRCAEAGDEVILTRHSDPVVRLIPVNTVRQGRHALLDSVGEAGAARDMPGPGAAQSQDFLYGDDGLPT